MFLDIFYLDQVILIVLRRGVTVISSDDVVWRFCLAFCSGALSMLVVASLSMMISSFVNNSIGPIVGTISIIIGLNIILLWEHLYSKILFLIFLQVILLSGNTFLIFK